MTAEGPAARLLDATLDGMRDHRVAAALRREFHGALQAEVESGLAGAPEDAEESALLVEVARTVTAFVASRRDEVVASMKAAGDGPCDRPAVLADATKSIAGIEALLEGVRRGEPAEMVAVEEAIGAAVERLEAVREGLDTARMDDALFSPPRPPPEGPIDPRTLPPPTDVEAAITRSWRLEADLYVAAAERVGPAAVGIARMTYEQEHFLLDALVAQQESMQVHWNPEAILRLATLRAFKGDTGEARALCGKALELDPEIANREGFEGLLAELDAASPISRDKRCFVATAALSPDAAEVEALRRWRDRVLLSSAPGRLLVAAYYRVSPPLARWIAARPAWRRVVRERFVVPLARRIGS
jgi:hypothetical protein